MSTLVLSSITPPILSTGNNNDFNPTGGDSAGFWRLSGPSFTCNVTGMLTGSANVDGYVVAVINFPAGVGSRQITFTNEDSNSTATNRFNLPDNLSYTLQANAGAAFIYDGTSQRWRMFSLANDLYPGMSIFGSMSIVGSLLQSGGAVSLSETAISGGIVLSGILNISLAGGAPHNDFNPGGAWPNIGYLFITPTSTPAITGFDATGVSAGQEFTLVNQSTTSNLALDANNAGSLAANRIFCPSGTSVTVHPTGSIKLLYTGAHWQVVVA